MDMRVGQVGAFRAEAPAREQQNSLNAPSMLMALVAVAVAVAIQGFWIPIDGDVSWLITVSERVLSGDRLYVDILEVNPPASVWIYLPLVWVAQLSGLRPEAVVVAAFIAAALVSVLVTLHLVSRLENAPRPLWMAGALSLIALIVPMGLFSQREHLALLLALPALAALALIAEGRPLATGSSWASGLSAGLIIVIKPYFLFAILAPAAWAAWKRRTIARLLPGIAGALLAIIAYAAALLVFAQDYLQWLPVIARTYAPMHEELWKLATGPALYPVLCVGLAFLLRPARIPTLAAMWLLGAAGFLIAAYLQAKNYPNHWLPQAGLAMAAVVALLPVASVDRKRRALVTAGLALVALSLMRQWTIIPDPAVAAAIRRVAPASPKIVALSPNLVTGHPVARNVDGQWVDSRAALFTAAGARFVGRHDPAVAADYREDINSFAADVARSRPDAILVEIKSKPWLMREQPIARTMTRYRLGAQTDEVEIWVPRVAD